MGGAKLIAMEAKCFDLVLEDDKKSFRLSVLEKSRGFIKSLLMGRDESFLLLSTSRDKALLTAISFIKHF